MALTTPLAARLAADQIAAAMAATLAEIPAAVPQARQTRALNNQVLNSPAIKTTMATEIVGTVRVRAKARETARPARTSLNRRKGNRRLGEQKKAGRNARLF
jgi:hypothetical protein